MKHLVRIGFLALLVAAVITISSSGGVLGSVGYTIRSNLLHNPGVTAAQMDNYIASIYPTSPLVGHSQMWIDAGNKYGIDSVFLMNLAILESGWGFSDIARDKKNLYGWQAYDTDPYGYAMSFPSFEAGTDYVAGKIKELYLTPGAPYYTYYGPTLEGMNVNYATSQTWRFSIARLMNEFASTIPGYNFPPILDQYGVIFTDVDTPSTMFAGQLYSATVRMWNIGKLTWLASDPTNPVHLSYHWYDSNGNLVLWDGERVDLPGDIAPGQEAIVAAKIRVPSTPGTYTLKYDLVREAVTWFSQQWTVTLNIRVNVVSAGSYSASYTLNSRGPGVYTSYLYPLQVTLTNTGTMTWPSGGANPVYLSYHWINLVNGATEYDGLRTPLPGDIPPGGSVTLNAQIRGPAVSGLYILKLDMVQEGITWFSWYGGAFTQNSPSLDIIIGVGSSHLSGNLIKTAGNPSIYVLEDGKRRWISSPTSFLSHGFRWDQVITISEAEMAVYPVGSTLQARAGTLLKAETNPSVYVTDLSGSMYIKRWITSPAAFEALGYKWEDIQIVSDVELSSYTEGAPISGPSSHPNGTLIKVATSPDVYFLEGGQKRYITSPVAFVSNGFRWDRIVTVTDEEMAGYPGGLNLQARPGTLIKDSTPPVYIIDFWGGAYYRRQISSPVVFEALGYRWGDIITVSSEEVGTYAVGSSVN